MYVLLCMHDALQASKAEVIDIQDTNWKVDSLGAPGQQLSLHLLLRVVADVGIVGLPNAGVICTQVWAAVVGCRCGQRRLAKCRCDLHTSVGCTRGLQMWAS